MELLEGSGRLSDTEADRLLGRKVGDDVDISQKQIRQMSSHHRSELAISRAKQGLPPNDDLAGMSSYHTNQVLEARQKYPRRRGC